MAITIAQDVWISAALLHREGRSDFSIQEVVERILREHLDEYRPGMPIHASNHCVASKAPNPAVHRFLHETGRGRRRLFRTGDDYHPNRRNGRTHPSADELPERYRYLVAWYENEYDLSGGNTPRVSNASPSGSGVQGKFLLQFFGSIPAQEAQNMTDAIRQGCERVDTREW